MGRVTRQLKELRHGWNLHEDSPRDAGFGAGQSLSYRQARAPARYYNDRSFVGSIYNRMAVDFAGIDFWHCKVDPMNVIQEVIRNSSLNNVLTLDPNIDQTAFALKLDIALTMFEHGHAAVVPVESNMDPTLTDGYNIQQLRVGRVIAWFPQKVTLEVYDDREVDKFGKPVNGGVVKQMTVPKSMVAIIENPFFNVMNMPNGLLQRFLRKWALLDAADEEAASGKLDLLLQLPYTVRGDSRRKQAKERRADLRDQLRDDELGIGYIDVSEKVVQLNRPVVNTLPDQILSLAEQIMNELGITAQIMNGSADRDTINNYYDRTIEPIATASGQEFKRKFLSKTARTQGQSVEYYRDPLKLIPMNELAEFIDKARRGGVVTANEIRPKIGLLPSKDPLANQMGNPNMPADEQGAAPPEEAPSKEVTDDGSV